MTPKAIHNKALPTLLLAVLAAFQAAAQDQAQGGEASSDGEDGWQVLFDGTSTDAFRGYNRDAFPQRGWEIDEDGSLHAISGGRGGTIITRQQYHDFDLRFEWKVGPGANSGVMYRIEEHRRAAAYMSGPEYQVLDDAGHQAGPQTQAGSLYALIGCNENKTLLAAGEWNTGRVVVQDNRVQHWLNGEVVVEYVLGSDALNELIQASKFRRWGNFARIQTGHIGFQEHGRNVWYRNIRIRDLGGEDENEPSEETP